MPLGPFPTAVLTSLPTVLPLQLLHSSCLIISLIVCKSFCTICRAFFILEPIHYLLLGLLSGLLLVPEAFFHLGGRRPFHVIVIVSSFLTFNVEILLFSCPFSCESFLHLFSQNLYCLTQQCQVLQQVGVLNRFLSSCLARYLRSTPRSFAIKGSVFAVVDPGRASFRPTVFTCYAQPLRAMTCYF